MNLHELPKTIKKEQKRLGQGHGSGRVKTSGRGTKGQNARHNSKITQLRYSGGSLAFVKALPFLRGKMRNYSLTGKPVVINVSDLNKIAKDTVVDLKVLVAHKLADQKDAVQNGVKILGNGDLSTALVIKNIPVTKGAREKIEKAGGKVE